MSRAAPTAAVDAVRALARIARLLERASGDLGLAQYRVLTAIAGGEDRAARVAERVGLGRPAVSAAVEALCRNGLVTRTEAATDQRAVDLAVTPEGRSILDRVEAEMSGVLTDLCDRSAHIGGCPGPAAHDPAADGPGGGSPGEGGPPAPASGALAVLASLGPAVDDLVAESRRHSERR